MIICENLDKTKVITNLDEWQIAAKAGQWKDGRSAKELAKACLKDKGQYLERLIGSKDEFEGIKFILGSPEYVSKFDSYSGGLRNHDLLVLAEDKSGQVLISMEAKVDEGFDEIIEEKYFTYLLNRINGKSTNLPDRIENLLASVFDRVVDKQVFELRYQLLHAIAGTVAEAKKRNIKRAIFVINTFRPKNLGNFNLKDYKRNVNDLNRFINYLSYGKIENIENDSLIGPFNTKSNDYLSNKVDLYIMKVESII